MEIRKPRRIPLSAQLVQEMERLIADGSWKLGERILPEPELVRLFGVSRNTVREALQALIHAGLLVAKPGDGTYVKRRTRMESVLHGELSGTEPEKVLEARLALEESMMGLAAANRTEADLLRLHKALELRNQAEDPELDAKFHICAAEATGNPLLCQFYREVCLYMVKNLPDVPLKVNVYLEESALHEKLYQAIAEQDADAAKKVTRSIIRIYAGRIGFADQVPER